MNPTPERTSAVRWLLLVLGLAAAAAGLYGRFKGIGIWPLGVDEFYISRSIDHVLQTGLPRFPCGNFYTRGLLYQYVVAGLRLLGWSPEFAGRFVAGIASLLVLPAAYRLGRRMEGSSAGWLAVIILLLSIWEIEMARFARMYTPFQAVFAWYLVAYLRYTVDRHAPALRWMVVLSVLGVLTWEGGALLGVANILAVLVMHKNGRLEAADWRRLAGLGLLLVLLVLATRDLRGFAQAPPTAGAPESEPEHASKWLQLASVWLAPLWRHPGWCVGLLLPLPFLVPAARWIASYRDRWLAAASLCLALAAAAAHLFLVSGAVLLLMLLLRLADWRELSDRRSRHFWWAMGGFLLFWIVCTALSFAEQAAPGASGHAAGMAAEVLHRVAGFPDVYDEIARPWGRTLPILSVEIAAALLYLAWSRIRTAPPAGTDPAAVLLSVIIVLALAIGVTDTDRLETRYTFFLYPLLVVLGVCAVLEVARRAAGRTPAAAGAGSRVVRAVITACVPLLCFGATEDFQPRHILEVDSAKVNFRIGMSAAQAAHYYPRNDVRGAARWLAEHAQPGDVVISGIPSLDQYDHRLDYFYLDEADDRYEAYVCPDNRTERWSNLPVLYTGEALKPIVASGRPVFAVLYASTEERLRAYAATAGWSVVRVWRTEFGTSDVVRITMNAPGAPAQAGTAQ
jgi:hypothetical protein